MGAKHGNLFSSVRKRQRAGRRAVEVETLEPRVLFDARGITFVDGILTITGTEARDELLVERYRYDTSKLIVQSWSYETDDPCWARGVVFDISAVMGIRIDGRGGDDFLLVANNSDKFSFPGNFMGADGILDQAVTLTGGDGDDELWSETHGGSLFLGGAGADLAYSVGLGNNMFAVERVEKRAADFFWQRASERGYFDWNGTDEDEIYADPWLAPNHGGDYSGAQIPDFDALTADAQQPMSGGSTGPAPFSPALPDAPAAEPSVAMAVPTPAMRMAFSTGASVDIDDLWDDAAA
jgi:hypothetical protein